MSAADCGWMVGYTDAIAALDIGAFGTIRCSATCLTAGFGKHCVKGYGEGSFAEAKLQRLGHRFG